MDKYHGMLMSKNGKVIISLVNEVLKYDVGDRIETVEKYAGIFKAGRGTVQAALKFLQETGAIKLESRGHLGTFIDYIDFKKLWHIAGFGNIIGVMPLPYSKRYEGLATGLYKVFEQMGISFNLAFMRGSTKRIEAVNAGKFNFAVVSKLAAKIELEKHPNLELMHEFSEGSFAASHVIIFKDKNENAIRDGMRIALDSTSTDQVLLTHSECKGKNVTFVETPYTQILQKLRNNEIDAAIWNGDEVAEKNLDFNISPLMSSKSNELSREDIIAVIVINKEYAYLGNIFKRFADMSKVEQIQKKVINGEIIPEY